MTASLPDLSPLRPRMDEAGRIADHVDRAVAASGSDSELALIALCDVAFRIASAPGQPGLAARTARSLRLIAALLDEVHAGTAP